MSMDWIIEPPRAEARDFAARLGVSSLTAQVLLNRGVESVEAAQTFLNPKLSDLYEPDRIFGMERAAELLAAAVRDRRRIVLYGDYDVDGITGVAILWHCLTLAGAAPDFYVPHRLEEGYGINTAAIEKLARDGAQVIVSVDCGITAIEPARVARRMGVELIITDHHRPLSGADGAPELPEAAAIVHPGLGESPVNPDLSGSGVALKLAWALAQKLSAARRVTPEFREFLLTATSVAALGLIADVVPLTGENRIVAHQGLRGLPSCPQPGVQALIRSARLDGKSLDGYDVGFKLAPRLNAIGRMGHAHLAVEMLTRATPEEAQRIAKNLEEQNSKRQALERRILADARDMVAERGMDGDGTRAIVLASEGWHAGVIGIVASRLVDEYGKPAVLIALENGAGQGSARSVRHFPLHEALHECRAHLVSYGGHAMAAGLRIESARFAAFAEAFLGRAAQRLTAADMRPRMQIDALADPSELVEPLMRELSRLGPHGMGNASPRFATDWLDLCGEPRLVGARSDHLQFSLGRNGVQRKAVAFGMAKHRDLLCDARRCRVAFRPMLNEWMGRRSVEMQVLDFQFP